MTAIGLSLMSLLLAELTSSLSARDFNLTSDHSVHTSHSHSLCGVRCETHVTDVCSVVRGVYRMLRVWCGVCVTCEDNMWLEILFHDLFSQTSQALREEVGSEYIQLFCLKYFNNLCPDCSLQQDRYYERN